MRNRSSIMFSLLVALGLCLTLAPISVVWRTLFQEAHSRVARPISWVPFRDEPKLAFDVHEVLKEDVAIGPEVRSSVKVSLLLGCEIREPLNEFEGGRRRLRGIWVDQS